MKKRPSPRKDSFLSDVPENVIENVLHKFNDFVGFNFQFFDNSQPAGQDFKIWTHEQLCKLLEKLKSYSGNSRREWLTMKVGGGKWHVLEIYGKFPHNTDFKHPKSVPLDVDWARFRLEGDMRLIGFFVPNEQCGLHNLKKDIFYIVFLDANHKFCKSDH